MKKITFIFVSALIMSVLGLQAQSWSAGNYGYSLTPTTANVGIGTTANNGMKLRLLQDDASNTGTLYNLYSSVTSNNASSTGGLYGAYLYNYKGNTNSSGSVFGIYNNNYNYSKTGIVYGLYSTNYNYNATAGTVYGNYIYGYNANANGTVYGIYSSVSGANTTKKWSGYFTGGDLEVNASVLSNNLILGKGNNQFIFHSRSWVPNDPPAVFIAPKIANTETWDWTKQVIFKNDGSIIMSAGNLGVGTTNPTTKLDVVGTIRAHEVKVCLNQGCDYVFDKDYSLMPITEVADYVKTNKHLPDVAPAAEMESEGINLSEMNALLLRKVEELTLYVIELKGEIDELKKK